MSSPFTLTPEQKAQFDRDGFLVIPDFFSPQQADELKQHSDHLIEQFDLSSHPRTIFTSNNDGSQCSKEKKTEDVQQSMGMMSKSGTNDYFLNSADQISFFFEEHAFNEAGNMVVPKEKAINKIGHYLHVLDEPFATFTHRPEVKQLAKDIGFKQPIVLQSMVICKQPKIGGVVNKHRDSTFLFTEPSTAVGFWFALEDCTKQNGCLWFRPGSHKDGASNRRFVRTGPTKSTINNNPTNPEDGPMNNNVELTFIGEDKISYPDEEFVCAEVKKGTVVVINGDVVHWSAPNLSPISRYIYTFHMIDAEGTTYPNENWLQSSKKFPRLFD